MDHMPSCNTEIVAKFHADGIFVYYPHIPARRFFLFLSFNLIFSGFWKGLRNDYE